MGEDAVITYDGCYYPHADIVADPDISDRYEIVARVTLGSGSVIELECCNVANVLVGQGDKAPRVNDFIYCLGTAEGQAAFSDYVRSPGPGWKCPGCGHGRTCEG